MLNVIEPSNYKEASQYNECREAMEEEYESILENKSWDLIELLQGR